MECKQVLWYKSRMLWVNGIAFLACIIQLFTGTVINGETQGIILTIINFLLRLVTKEEIIWTTEPAK